MSFREIIEDIPLYKELYGSILLSDISEKDLSRLPELTKQMIGKEFPSNWKSSKLQKVLKENDYELMTTSGTSSERTQLIRPKNWWYGEEQRLYNYIKNISPKYTEMNSKAILTTAICSNTICYKEVPPYEKRIVNGILHLNITPDPNCWTKEDVQRIVSEIDRFSPQCFQADPVYLAIFIKYLRKFKISPPKWTPHLLVLTYEFCPQKCLKMIHSLWNIPTCIIYGTTETGFLFYQVENKISWMGDSIYLFFKPLPSPNENICELLLTSFRNPFMPFINYNSRDLFYVKSGSDSSCPSGSELVADKLMGRTKDLTYSSNGKCITVRDIDDSISQTDNSILFYFLNFSFEKKIIFSYMTINDSSLTKSQQQLISDTIVELYNGAYQVELTHEKEIKPSSSGKFEIIKKSG